MVRRKKAGYRYKSKKRSSSKKKTSVIKRRLAGFTKVKGKYALVFKRGPKMSIGTGKYGTKASLQKAAAKYL